MELSYKQKILLIVITVFLLIIILLKAIYITDIWISIISFAPIFPFFLLLFSTNQKIFQVKKQWGYALFFTVALQLVFTRIALSDLLFRLGFTSKAYGSIIFIGFFLSFAYFYSRKAKKVKRENI